MEPAHHSHRPGPGDGASLSDRPAARYLGDRINGVATVLIEDDRGHLRPLPLRLDLRSHSPTGFEWGYGGSGPAQLALALLTDAVGADKARAGGCYQQFKFAVVAALAGDSWELTREAVLDWYRAHTAGRGEPPAG